MVIADPPYTIGKNFGNNKEKMTFEDYKAWSKTWIIDLLSWEIKDNGVLYIYGFRDINIVVNTPVKKL